MRSRALLGMLLAAGALGMLMLLHELPALRRYMRIERM
jgi:hypothetical protein